MQTSQFFVRHTSMNVYVPLGSVLLTGVVGSYFTSLGVRGPWYACVRPSFTPPSFVFGIVWTCLYIALGVAYSRSYADVMSRRLFAANLALNVAWCWLFFAMSLPGPALCALGLTTLTALWICIRSDDSVTKALMMPYIAWTCFAILLNAVSLAQYEKCAALRS